MSETWPFKDSSAKPKKGRYFPLSFGEAIAAAKRWNMLTDSDKRVRIAFENPRHAEGEKFSIVAYRPAELLVIESWPDSVSQSAARLAVAKAFPVLAQQRHRPETVRGRNMLVWYLARFSKDGDLRLIERCLHLQRAAYRAGQKFSNSFKSKVTRVEDRLVPLQDRVEPDAELVGGVLA